MIKKSLRYSTLLALGTAVISGTAIFLSKIAVTVVKDPIVYTTLKNGLVAIFLLGVIFAFKKWPEIIALNKRQIFKLLAIGIIGGAVPFALFFTGLTKTAAVNAGLIHKTLFLWVLLLGIPLLKERLTRPQWLGIGALFAANLIVGGFTGFKYNSGELMILGATLFWAIENIIAKITLRDISSLIVASARMTIGSLLLGLLIIFQGKTALLSGLTALQWGWTLLMAGFLSAYVLTWYTALKYAPATYVATLLVPATLITNLLSAVFITHAFSLPQLIKALLYLAGVGLMIFFAKETIRQSIEREPQKSYASTPS